MGYHYISLMRMLHSCDMIDCCFLKSPPSQFNISPWLWGYGPMLNVGPLASSQCLLHLVAALIPGEDTHIFSCLL